jgi:hypothetical protein
MTNEHLWPLWLIKHADIRRDGVAWAGQERVNPRTATLPLCRDCNHRLGAELEGPVSRILPRLEAGAAITDGEAELLVRWLWKFEGLAACYAHLDDPAWRYSDRWALIERVLGTAIQTVRDRLTLAVGLTNQNDPEHQDWPMGIDSGISDLDGFFVSGVFKKTAIMVSFSDFDDLVPTCFGRYRLGTATNPLLPCFTPPVCFPFSANAIEVTKAASIRLKRAHEEFAREHHDGPAVRGVRPRLEIPN